MPESAGLIATAPRLALPREPYWLAAAGLAGFVLFLLFVTRALGLDVLQSDAVSYWRESLDWRRPFSVWWVPGYPLTLALANGLMGGLTDPRPVMLTTAGLFYAAGIALTWELARSWGLSVGAARACALIFACYPFVGITYAVYPVADGMALALVLLMALAISRGQPALFSAASAGCLLTHKATWFFVAAATVFVWMRLPGWRRWCVLPLVPFAIYLAAGALYFADPLWMIRWSGENLFAPRGGLPLVDSTLGLLLTGVPSKAAKGLVVLTILLAAGATALASGRERRGLGAALALALIAMGLTLNQYEAWAAVRFSKVLVVPAVACALPFVPSLTTTRSVLALSTAAALGLATNALYAAYMAWFFSSPAR